MDPGWVTAAVALATVFVTVAAWIVRYAWRLIKRFLSFINDWDGTPSQHNRDRVPGVMERLSNVESNVALISDQVHYNGGKSLKDVVVRTEIAVSEIQKTLQLREDQRIVRDKKEK